MIDYKSTSASDSLNVERLSSAGLDGPVSLTWLWEVIVRTKRLPDDLDPKVLFVVLRDRLRNPEREVRQHALRVLADLIPVVEPHVLDKHIEFILPELIINLSNVAPSVRKGTVDVLRIHLKHTLHPNDFVKKLINSVSQDSHLMVGVLMTIPYFTQHLYLNEETLIFLLRQLFDAISQEFLKETSVNALVKAKHRLGPERFNHLIGPELVKDFEDLCKELNIHQKVDDNVILETEITLEAGPAITMKIHEETTGGFNDDVFRSPRKVHFGGEVVKMRTPESDSNHQSSDDNDVQTSLVMDRPTSIKITVNEGVAAIKTRHRSMIPVRISTGGGSNPSTPRKKLQPKRLHKSAPELGRLHSSRIPLRHNNGNKKKPRRKLSRGEDLLSPIPVHNEIEVFHNLTRSPDRTSPVNVVSSSEAVDDQKYVSFQVKETSPSLIPFDSGERKSKRSTETVPKVAEDKSVNCDKKAEVVETEAVKAAIAVSSELPALEALPDKYTSFQVCREDLNGEVDHEGNASPPLPVIVHDLLHKDDIWTRSRTLDDLIAALPKSASNLDTLPLPQLLQVLFTCEHQQRLQQRAQEALRMVISGISLQRLYESLGQLGAGLGRMSGSASIRLALFVMQRSSPRQFFAAFPMEGCGGREGMLRMLIAAARTFPSSDMDVVHGTELAFEAMMDNKRPVRQAALEALASLAQLAGNAAILRTVKELAKEHPEADQLLRVVRTRLSRRQLPMVDLNGYIRYSSPREQEELDWLCGGIPILQKTTSLNSMKVNNNNYWKHNSRHDRPLVKSPSMGANGEVLESSNDEPSGDRPEQIWAIDGPASVTVEKATLCPLYVLHRESPQLNGKSYRNYDRGRSNSPPRPRNQPPENFDDTNAARRFFRHSEQFRKSFSSEQIYNGPNIKHHEPTSFSLSSRSSTTSTGSSTKSGLWLREFKSGIPVPIPTETKFKFRSHRHVSDMYTSGPLIAQDSINNRTKLESPHHQLPSPPHQQVFNQQMPPPSSGSESSGYFTPPAEHHLKDQAIERFVHEEAFEENNNLASPPPNFDSEASESHQDNDLLRQSSVSSGDDRNDLTETCSMKETILDVIEVEEQPTMVLAEIDEVDFNENIRTFTDPRSKSKSEANLKTTLPEITERKNINSAPPLNDIANIVPYTNRYPELPSPPKTSLPGSITSHEQTPEKHPTESARRLLRRTISTRASSLKRSHHHKVVKTPESASSFCRPKEALNQSLVQMDSGDWERTMEGLNGLINLCHSHPDILESQIHAICVGLAKNIKNLRSQVARTACHASSELFNCCKRSLDMEVEELAGPLLQRTADTNKFLRGDANAALDAMALNLSVPRVVAAISNKGATHHNCVVRAAAIRILGDIAMRLGPEKIYQLPKEIRDKFLLVGANGLNEGSLETRRHAKTLMGIMVKHYHFQKALFEAVPHHIIRHITKAINSLK